MASKTYISSVFNRTARPRSERLRKLGVVAGSVSSSSSSSSSGGGGGSSHTHSNLEDLETLSVNGQTLLINAADATVANATHATSADSAATAASADALSSKGVESIRDNYISKDQDDGTEHSLYVNGGFTVSNTFQVEPDEGQSVFIGPLEIDNTLDVTGAVTASGLGLIGNASGEYGYMLAITKDNEIKRIPTNITYQNNAVNIGNNNSGGGADLNVYGDLYVKGAVEYQTLEVDTATITKFTSSGATYLGTDKLIIDNGKAIFFSGAAEGTSEDSDLVQFYGSPLVWHYDSNQGGWYDYNVLDWSMVCEAIDGDDITDNVVTDRAVTAYVKDYVTANAVEPLDVSALTTEGGKITSCMKNLLHQPLYVKTDDTYASAKLLCQSGGSTDVAWLLWDVVTSSKAYPQTIRHYAMELTGNNGGAVPYQTDGIIQAYDLYYRDETLSGWNPA